MSEEAFGGWMAFLLVSTLLLAVTTGIGWAIYKMTKDE